MLHVRLPGAPAQVRVQRMPPDLDLHSLPKMKALCPQSVLSAGAGSAGAPAEVRAQEVHVHLQLLQPGAPQRLQPHALNQAFQAHARDACTAGRLRKHTVKSAVSGRDELSVHVTARTLSIRI